MKENFKNHMVSGEALSKLKIFVWILSIFSVHKFVSVQRNSIKLKEILYA